MTPPRIPRALVGAVAPPDDRPHLLADLDEEFADQVVRHGASSARRWYWAQCVTSVPPLLARRLGLGRRRGSGTAARSRARPAPARPGATRGGGLLDGLVQDVHFAARSFLRAPGFTVVALLTLAVAVGANTAIFSVVNGVLFKRAPGLTDTDGLVEISQDVKGSLADMSYPIVRLFQNESTSLETTAAMDWQPVSMGTGDRPEVHVALAVTASYFDVLRVRAMRGRLFAHDEATFPSVRPVAVISDRLRRERFADAEIPGASLVVNGVSLTIVGVTAPGFRGHTLAPVDVFVPLGLQIPGLISEGAMRGMRNQDVEVLARLRSGATIRQAAQELSALGDASMVSETGAKPGAYRVRVDRWGWLPASARGGVALFLSGLLVLAGLVLAMACINVAGMALSRASERGGEIAVRVALGAGRGRIVRQLLSEATLLALVAGACGLLLSVWVTRLLLTFKPPLPPGYELTLDFSMDWRVVAYTLGVALGTALIFNLAPAVHAARTDVMGVIKGDAAGGRRRRTWSRAALVSGQMAMSLVLLVTAGLFLRSIAHMRTLDPGWSADDVYTTDVDLELTGTSDADGAIFYGELLDRLARAPEVQAVGLGHKLPLGSSSSMGDVSTDGTEPPPGQSGFRADFLRISSGYLETLDLALIRGRDFTDDDRPGATAVALVNETMARHLWPGQNALGKVFRAAFSKRELTVVGVVEDARYKTLSETTPNFYYVPSTQWYDAHMILFAKAAPGRGDALRARVESTVAALQPNLPVDPPKPLEASLGFALAPPRIAAWVSGVLGALGLLLGAVGVYGVTSFAVSQRSREIGIRMALGATRGGVASLMVRQGMTAPLVGMVLGLGGALAVAHLMSGFMGGVGALDAVAFGSAVSILVAVAFVATVAPVWRATHLHPVSTLRSE